MQKKDKQKAIFISYRHKPELSQQIAEELYKKLTDLGHYVFLDVRRMPPGFAWAEEIYKQIRESDVLIVLLEDETAESDWVQREVDIARGLRVSILPILIGPTDPQNAMKKLAVDHIHGVKYQNSDQWMDDFEKAIANNIKKTEDDQRQLIKQLQDKERTVKAPDNQRYAAFRLKSGVDHCKVWLASGDMMEFNGIDVIVNSENNYMQMARAFEMRTVSGRLRYMGSLREGGNRILEDTIQKELDEQLQTLGGPPVGLAERVLVTQAGHPDSQLRAETGSTYIFHVAAVRVVPYGPKNLEPMSEPEVTTAVRKCLRTMHEVTEPVTSIVFPLLGTGMGGLAPRAVVPAMLDGIEKFLKRDDKNQQVREIYVCAYEKDDLQVAHDLMLARFNKVTA